MKTSVKNLTSNKGTKIPNKIDKGIYKLTDLN